MDPRVPQKWTRTRSVSRLIFAAVSLGELQKVRALQLVGLDDGDPARGDRRECRRAGTILEVGPLPEERTGSVLGQALAVVLDPDHPVEDQEDLGAGLALLAPGWLLPGIA